MQKIIGVKRDKEKVLYYFIENIPELKLGDRLVVDFDDFETIVTVAKLGMEVEDDKAAELKGAIRRATDSDIARYDSLKKKASDYLPQIKKISLSLGLLMKFVSAEYSLDASKILIIFSSEERVDFRQLLKELAVLLKARIELKQIGQRDEVKICGAVGQCGQPCCCSRFLKDFEHVTVKMAKIQGLSLSPSKINGVCGRLLCCLGYESEMYEEMVAKMPKVGSEIMTPNGTGTVVFNDILRERVSVKRRAEGDTFVVEDFALSEVGENAVVKKVQNDEETLEKTLISAQSDENLNSEEKIPETGTVFNKSSGKTEKPQEMELGGSPKQKNNGRHGRGFNKKHNKTNTKAK